MRKIGDQIESIVIRHCAACRSDDRNGSIWDLFTGCTIHNDTAYIRFLCLNALRKKEYRCEKEKYPMHHQFHPFFPISGTNLNPSTISF